MDLRKRLLVSGWVVVVGTIILGSLGYIQELFGWRWSQTYNWLLFIVFVCLSVAEILIERQKNKRAAEDFYAEEVTEIFNRNNSKPKMQFFVDQGNNKCVALTLQHEAIPNSVKLWEGGYAAPPVTIVVKNNVVGFRPSAYSSYEEYKQSGGIYSVKYYPKISGARFRVTRK